MSKPPGKPGHLFFGQNNQKGHLGGGSSYFTFLVSGRLGIQNNRVPNRFAGQPHTCLTYFTFLVSGAAGPKNWLGVQKQSPQQVLLNPQNACLERELH